ncbi:MAG: hypothetical protein HeimC2_15620 [Candidatus Heimdallarchaeota archaeon LC_2]|nr:MAG: hypothetical protein HeimC2_15620 [Candidatus Heimdallarchaeota archaeon LC_2]
MLKKFLFLSFSLLFLILVGSINPTSALDKCDGRTCYNDILPINEGDSFTWIYEKENTKNTNYYNIIDKGLPSDFAMNEGGTTLIQIMEDIRGISNLDYLFAEDKYFETSITIEGSEVPTSVSDTLFETLLIYPTINNLDGNLVNIFEFLASIRPFEEIIFNPFLDHHEIKLISRTINDGIFTEFTEIEVAVYR